jgi:3-oxosteroid 1-dehydrogenase
MTSSTSPAPHEPNSRLSRRDFLVAAGSGPLLTAATVAFQESTAHAQLRWDHETDVVVVGTGAAAASAALFAHEGGARVLMIEKAAVLGGTSRKSGGGYWIPNNYMMRAKGWTDPREDCIRYMARIAYPTLYQPQHARLGLPENEYNLLTAFYDSAAPTIDALRAIGAFDKHVFSLNDDGDFWPDYYAQLPENKAPRGRTLFSAHPDGRTGNGVYMMEQLRAALDKRQIRILFKHRAVHLVMNSRREVVGLEVATDDRTVAIRARKGVIFGTGGFTSNPEMCLSFLRGPVFGGCTVPSGQGDFVHIGSAAGGKLANMAHAWWWPVLVEQALQFRSTPTGVQPSGDSMIAVNRFGRRVVNEWVQYNERTQAHFAWDPHTCSYPNLILFVIYDQFTRERFGEKTGLVVRPGIKASYILSAQTLEELAAALEKRLSEIADRTGGFSLDREFVPNLKDTITRFNQFAETGVDLDFHRGETPIELASFGKRRPGNDKPNRTIYPIRSAGPYYAVMTGGGTLDTKGGPKINASAQVLNEEDRPIPGLYGAGNCIASPAGQGYWAGGATLGPALTFGALAGKHAAAAAPKELS